jgi:uncharacterized protein (DUF433 family)
MVEQKILKRITANPEIFSGKPIIRGMRISVELVLSLLAQGETVDAILSDYPDLEPADIQACLAYAHAVIAYDTLDTVDVTGR